LAKFTKFSAFIVSANGENSGMSRYSGMTVNERLFEAGIMDQWTTAAELRDRNRMIELLGQVELSEQAEQVVDTILANPRRYGF
jgi:hypothetical protein